MRIERYYCNVCKKMVKLITYFEEGREDDATFVNYPGTLCKECYKDLQEFIQNSKGKEIDNIKEGENA